MRRKLPYGTVTFFFTDVEGSTKLLHELGAEAYAEKLAEHRRVVREACTARGGVEVDTQGDAFFVAFPTAPGALDAARAITEELASGPITLRIGLHSGAPLVTEEGYIGEEVHFAARVAASAHGGQVVLSQATRALLDDRYPLVELGEHRLKDIPEPVPIFQLGDGQFPPLKTISNTNLPRPASYFVGREGELAEVLSCIEGGARLLTLTGPGGTGKTRLALEVAATLVPEYKAGVFWVGLAELRDPALVTQTIAQTLGAKDGLADHIGEREMLLLIDNLEQVIDAAPELSALLTACLNLTLLVTSRELLRVQGEVEYEVPPLASPEAVALFCERSQLGPSEEIAALGAHLDNLPLAVELAAARAKVLSPAQIIERLSQRLDLLKGGRDADPRQQTLRATIEWSYDLLSEEEQQLFAYLAVFAGGCTLEAAEQVCDAELDTLQSLVEKSLLYFTNARYWMLETIREYGDECLEHSGESAEVHRRHALWFTAFVEEAQTSLRGAVMGRTLERIEVEHDNVRAALQWVLPSGSGELGLRLAGTMGRFWWIRGHQAEGRRWLKQLLEMRDGVPPNIASQALLVDAWFADLQGERRAAMSHGLEAVDLARKSDDADVLTRALNTLAGLMVSARRYSDARALYEEVGSLGRSSSETGWVAIASMNLGELGVIEGDFAGACRSYEQSLALGYELENDGLICGAALGLADALLRRGRFDESRGALSEGLRRAQKLGFAESLARGMLVAATVIAQRGSPQVAATLLSVSDRLFAETGIELDPDTSLVRDSLVERLHATLGRSRLQTALAEWRELDTEHAVELSLEYLE